MSGSERLEFFYLPVAEDQGDNACAEVFETMKELSGSTASKSAAEAESLPEMKPIFDGKGSTAGEAAGRAARGCVDTGKPQDKEEETERHLDGKKAEKIVTDKQTDEVDDSPAKKGSNPSDDMVVPGRPY